MQELKKLLDKYNQLNLALSLEEEEELIANYIYSTNKLEGNKISLSATKSIIQDNIIQGEPVRVRDLLEQRGTHKALLRMLNAVANKEPLSIELIKEFNWLSIGSLYNEGFYNSYKTAGQKFGDFKVKNNKIEVVLSSGKREIIKPYSSPENAELNLKMVLARIKNSQDNIINKASFLAQEIWLQQPFIDGNKRTARLLINFMIMKAGFPLFTYNKKGIYFNDILVRQYFNKEKGLLSSFIKDAIKNRLNELIEQNKELKTKKNKRGYRFLL